MSREHLFTFCARSNSVSRDLPVTCITLTLSSTSERRDSVRSSGSKGGYPGVKTHVRVFLHVWL